MSHNVNRFLDYRDKNRKKTSSLMATLARLRVKKHTGQRKSGWGLSHVAVIFLYTHYLVPPSYRYFFL